MISAKWNHLVMLNYKCPAELIQPFVPKGTELDLYNGDCYISLVAFLFENTHVFGIPAYGNMNFPEINLRYYIKRGDKKAVGFIKEIVNKPLVTTIANKFWNENYETLPLEGKVDLNYPRYDLHYKISGDLDLRVEADPIAQSINDGTVQEFIAEHYWGYSKGKKTVEYEVKHPKWNYHNILDYKLKANLHKLYGKDFAAILKNEPDSAFVCDGSEVTVSMGTTLN